MNPQQMMQVMKSFTMEMDKMGIQQEMMNDGFDMLADPDQEADADDVYN